MLLTSCDINIATFPRGAQFAFNPKDVKSQAPKKSYNAVARPTESEIRDRIKRLSHIFSDKVLNLLQIVVYTCFNTDSIFNFEVLF